MPSAANYHHSWGPLPQPCFQIYGTKRKASHTETPANGQFSTAIKRHCIKLSPNQRHTTDPSPCQPQHLPTQPSSQWQQRTPPSLQSDLPLSSGPSPAFQQSSSMQVTDAASPQHPTSMHSLPPSHGSPLTPCSSHSSQRAGSEDWQSPENLRRQMELQSEQQRLGLEAAARRTKAEEDDRKLDMEFESNDYWDVPYNHQLLKMADDLEQARIAMETDMESLQQQNGSVTVPSESTVHVPGLEAVSQIRCYCKPSWEGLLEPASYI